MVSISDPDVRGHVVWSSSASFTSECWTCSPPETFSTQRSRKLHYADALCGEADSGGRQAPQASSLTCKLSSAFCTRQRAIADCAMSLYKGKPVTYSCYNHSYYLDSETARKAHEAFDARLSYFATPASPKLSTSLIKLQSADCMTADADVLSAQKARLTILRRTLPSIALQLLGTACRSKNLPTRSSTASSLSPSLSLAGCGLFFYHDALVPLSLYAS